MGLLFSSQTLKDVKTKKEMYFTRWGSLNPVKHKEARKHETFHTAPKVYGIYAFPRGYIERFLIGGSYSRDKMRFLLNEKGERIRDNEFWSEGGEGPKPEYKRLLKLRGLKIRDTSSILVGEIWYVAYYVKPKRFYYTGPVWSHLGDYMKKEDIIEESGCWVKTTYKVWLKALHKADTMERFESYIKWSGKHGNPHTYPRFTDKDHFEVFIERI